MPKARGPAPQTRVGQFTGKFCQFDTCDQATREKLPFCTEHWNGVSERVQTRLLMMGSMHHTRHPPEFYQAIECALHDLRGVACPCGDPHDDPDA